MSTQKFKSKALSQIDLMFHVFRNIVIIVTKGTKYNPLPLRTGQLLLPPSPNFLNGNFFIIFFSYVHEYLYRGTGNWLNGPLGQNAKHYKEKFEGKGRRNNRPPTEREGQCKPCYYNLQISVKFTAVLHDSITTATVLN